MLILTDFPTEVIIEHGPSLETNVGLILAMAVGGMTE